jgi:histidinol dehydrogenase
MSAVPATVAGVKAIVTKVRQLAPDAKLVVVVGLCRLNQVDP